MTVLRAPRSSPARRRCAVPVLLGWAGVVSLLHLLGPRAAGAVLPKSASVTVDGDFADWDLILLNPANTTWDGEGSTLDRAQSDDRDCPVPSPAADLRRFAWTWDSDAVFVYVELHGPTGRDDYQWIWMDTDGDLRMSGNAMQAQASSGDFRVFDYRPDDPVGDPLVDGAGLADGYTMPGSDGNEGNSAALSGAGDAEGRRFEGRLPWSWLGVEPGGIIRFHVSAADRERLPRDVRDNLGGPGGGLGEMVRRALTIDGGRLVTAQAGETARIRHRVTNAGNVPTTVALELRGSCGYAAVAWLDVEGDGVGDTSLGVDAHSDGRWDGEGDLLTPEGDSDGDGLLDLGVLAPGAWVDLVLEQPVPSGAACTPADLEVTVWAIEDGSVRARARDVVALGDLTLTGGGALAAVAGDVAWHAHVAGNGTGATANVTVEMASSFGWTRELFLDPDGDGDPADAVPLPGGMVALPPNAAVPLLIRTDVPEGAPRGQRDFEIVRLLLGGVTQCFTVDETVVSAALELTPSHVIDLDDERRAPSGGSAWLPHRVIGARGAPVLVALDAVSDLGWTGEWYLDPDQDGRAHDAIALPSASILTGANADPRHVLLRVDVPAAEAPPTMSRLTLGALSDRDDSAEAHDDVVAAIVRVHEDELGTVAVNRMAACAPVHAVASGLEPSRPEHRFVWRDGSGLVVRTRDLATDVTGEARDAWLPPGPGEASVEIQRLESVWQVLDTAAFHVVDAVRVDALSAATSPGPSTGVVATAEVVNDDEFARPRDLRFRWLVLDPSRTLALTAAGDFVPVMPGQDTASETIPVLPSGESWTLVLGQGNVTFPEDGTYPVELWRSLGCGDDEVLVGETAFAVIADADGDGLTDGEESSRGTDPADADSDDDGRLDGEELGVDSDGDGFIDPLDCDADDDGLPDGLEAGVLEPSWDTDLGAGCFLPDLDLATTTDPTLADTDAGGRTDAEEDVDANGRVDAGETDPLDPADDLQACRDSPPPAVTGLRVERTVGGVQLTWTPQPGACLRYRVWRGAQAALVDELVEETPAAASFVSGLPALVFLQVQAVDQAAGPGAL